MGDQPVSPQTVTREALYERVWTTPMRHLAKEYGLSDVGLSKLCRRHEIPTPPVGYWAKKQWGKPVEQPPLPDISDPNLAAIDLWPSAPEDTRPLRETFFDPELGALAEVEAREEMPIKVAAKLNSPHQLVIEIRERLTGMWRQSSGREHRHTPPRSYGRSQVDVLISKPLHSRSLRILDALLKAFEIRGYKVGETRRTQRTKGCIEALGFGFTVRLREPSIRSDHIPTAEERERLRQYPGTRSVPRWDYTPSGRLQLELISRAFNRTFVTLRDGKEQRIEEALNVIPLKLLRGIDAKRRSDAELERWERQRREKAELQRQEEQRRQEEEARIQALHIEVDNWHQSRRIREYLDAIREAANQKYGFIEPDSRLAQNLAWAESVAERLDPLASLRPDGDDAADETTDQSFRRVPR